ncbi:MAG TPA: hypothetical protein VJX30_17570, partial [Terriglobales bacterium]|nr:hypothetical protein [Terriglobales bacterium]
LFLPEREKVDATAEIWIRVQAFRIEDTVVFNVIAINIVLFHDHGLATEGRFANIPVDIVELSVGVLSSDELRIAKPKNIDK